MDNQELERRLSAAVYANCSQAELVDWAVTEENSVEVITVVLWRNGRESGTHRALLSQVSPNGVLVWGHYYRDSPGSHAGLPGADLKR